MSELFALPTALIRARRRPRAVLVLWLWESALGLLVGAQIASVASAAYGHHPEGALSLFEPGALALLDLLRHASAARGPLVTAILIVALVAHVGGILPSSFAVAELAFRRRGANRAPTIRATQAMALRAFFPSLTLEVLALTGETALALLGFAVATAASEPLVARFGDPTGNALTVAIAALGFLAAACAGAIADTARAAVVRDALSAPAALVASLTAWAKHPVGLVWSYGWRAVASLVPVALGLAVTARARPSAHPELLAVIVLGVLHQSIVVARVAIRSSWMARVLRGL